MEFVLRVYICRLCAEGWKNVGNRVRGAKARKFLPLNGRNVLLPNRLSVFQRYIVNASRCEPGAATKELGSFRISLNKRKVSAVKFLKATALSCLTRVLSRRRRTKSRSPPPNICRARILVYRGVFVIDFSITICLPRNTYFLDSPSTCPRRFAGFETRLKRVGTYV